MTSPSEIISARIPNATRVQANRRAIRACRCAMSPGTPPTPVGDTRKFGDRALWRGFITYFKGNDDVEK